MGGKGSGGYRKNALPRDKNPIVQGNNLDAQDPDFNHRTIELGKKLFAMPDPDYTDPDAMQERFFEYLTLCDEWQVRPSVTGVAMAFGMNRGTLYNLRVGAQKTYKTLTQESLAIVQKSYEFLEKIYEDNLQEEKGSPVKWIFLGKNHYGYRDQTERVNIKIDDTKPQLTAAEVQEKYAKQLGKQPDTKELPEIVEVETLPDGAD